MTKLALPLLLLSGSLLLGACGGGGSSGSLGGGLGGGDDEFDVGDDGVLDDNPFDVDGDGTFDDDDLDIGDGGTFDDDEFDTGDGGTFDDDEFDLGDGGTLDDDPFGGLGDDDGIFGLWDASEESDGVIDVIYLRIAPGEVTGYDYLGDQFDLGENCYEINSVELESLGGGRYRFLGAEVALSTSDGNLRITSLGSSESVTLPPVRGLSETDFNECV